MRLRVVPVDQFARVPLWRWANRERVRGVARGDAPCLSIWRLLDAPDLLVFVLVPVAGVEEVLRAAILVDVGVDEQVDMGDIAARRLAGESAVQFVDRLPAVQMQWLSDGRHLILLLPDALKGRHRSIPRGDLARIACGGVDACSLQRRR